MSPVIIRPSMLGNSADCARRAAAGQWPAEFAEAGIELRQVDQTAGALVGKCVHAGLEHYFKQKLNTLYTPSFEDAEVEALNKLKEETELGWMPDPTTNNMRAAEIQICRMVRENLLLVGHEEPLLVEHKLTANLEDGFELHGQIDLVLRRKRLIDFKSGTKKGEYHLQFGSYLLLLAANDIEIDDALELWTPRSKAKYEQRDIQQSFYDMESCMDEARNEILRLKQNYTTMVMTGSPSAFPFNNNSFICSKKYCICHSTPACAFGRKTKEDQDSD